jgi:hypothetical protein
MKRLVNSKLILLYLLLFSIAKYAFSLITSHILKRPDITPHPIDVHVLECFKFFDYQYVQNARQFGYNHANYFKLFFPLDLVFPIIYSLLFLSIVQQLQKKTYFKTALVLIFTGYFLDYGENFSFAIYLIYNLRPLAFIVAFFTSLKSIVFAFNCVFALIGLFSLVKNFICTKPKLKKE